jgi:hypothetical protein
MAAISRGINQWIFLVVGNLTIPCTIAWEYHLGDVNTRVVLIAGLACILIFNGWILIAIRSQLKKLGQLMPRRLYAGAICLGAFSAALTGAVVHSVPQRNSYLELALSGTPTDEIQPKEKALVVGYLRRDLAASNAFDKLAAHDRLVAQTNALPSLYSPASFMNAKVMHAVSGQVREAYETDLAYYRLLQNNADEFHEEMAEVDPEYLRSFETSQRERKTQRDKLFQTEQQWAASVFGLYDYAAENAKEITVKGADFHFANDKVRSEFNGQLEQSKSLFNSYQAAFQEAARTQQKDRKDLGLR